MTRGCGILIAVGLSLSGCKYLEKIGRGDRPPPDDDRTSLPTSGRKERRTSPADAKPDNHWLDGPTARNSRGDLPEAPAGRAGRGSTGTFGDAPRGRPDDLRGSQGTLAGYVADETGRKLRGVFIDVAASDRTAAGAATGVETTDDGSFQIDGLRAGQTYILSAKTTREGVTLAGQMYAVPPNPRLMLVVREGLSLPGDAHRSDGNRAAAGDDLGTLRRPPPAPVPLSADRVVKPTPTEAGPADGSFSPTGPSPALTRPAPTRPPGRPELTTDGPQPGFRLPPTNIPPPDPLMNVPSLPPVTGPDGGKSESRSVRPKGEFVLLDTLGRPKEFPTGRSGELTLIEFMTTTCPPCRQAVPALKDLQARYGARGLDVIGVACDEVDTAQRRGGATADHKAEHLNYLLYVEPGREPGRVRDRFQVEYYPMMVLVDSVGQVLWKGNPKGIGALERVIDAELGR